MIIHKITPSVDYYKWLKRLNTQLNKPTNKNSFKVSKVFKLMNKKTLKVWRLVNKQPIVPSLFDWNQFGNVFLIKRAKLFR